MSAAALSIAPSTGDAALTAVLIALRDLAELAAAVDLEAADGDRAFPARAAGALRQLLEHALELLAALQRDDDEPAGDDAEPDAWLAAPAPRCAASRVGDVGFAGRMELKRALRELIAAPDDDARLVAAETGRRKLCHAIRAVLEAARDAGVHDVWSGEHHGSLAFADLAAALAIRRLYAGFRRGLRRATANTPEAVLTAVRYAGGALAILVADPNYAEIRASDRAVLRELRERALHWARHDRSVPAGLHLIEDAWTCGHLLRGINRRQELRDHDRALIAALLRGPDGDAAAWFVRLDALFGLDDELDAVLDRARALRGDGAPLDRLVPEALVRLAQVH